MGTDGRSQLALRVDDSTDELLFLQGKKGNPAYWLKKNKTKNKNQEYSYENEFWIDP